MLKRVGSEPSIDFSPLRIGILLNSAASHRISKMPLIFVVFRSAALKISTVLILSFIKLQNNRRFKKDTLCNRKRQCGQTGELLGHGGLLTQRSSLSLTL